MKKLIFLDTETTGNDPFADRLMQVCYKTEEGVRAGYFKPPLPISVKAMSVTHITNEMVEDKESFADSDFKRGLQKILDESILVAHNAPFDIAMLRNEGVVVSNFIDTLRVARHLDPEGKIPEYNLQYLRYFLGINVEASAHDAVGDVLVLEALFQRLFKKMRDVGATDAGVIEEMMKVSLKPSLMVHFTFGKYKGRKVSEVAEIDRSYLEWLLGQKIQNEEGDADWIYTLKNYLGK